MYNKYQLKGVISMDGERLKDLRKDRGLTQKQFAEIMGVSENSISLYERNETTPDDEMKIKIAKFFNVSLDYLLGIIKSPLPIERTGAFFIFADNMPKNAAQEMKTFYELK